jgi:alkylation response protein AidB-like acyl-CoA dehydrogenase
MFIVEIHQPGIQVEQIRQVNGSTEFCQEFFDDVAIPAADVVGAVDDGWTVASRLLIHERAAVGGASPYTSGRSMGQEPSLANRHVIQSARDRGTAGDAHVRQLIAESHVLGLVGRQLVDRVTEGMATGTMHPASGSLLKLFGATSGMRRTEIGLEVAGPTAVTWPATDGSAEGPAGQVLGEMTLWRQGLALGGGSNEMQRNLISERVLGMPREFAADKDVPYRDVPRAGR